MHRAIPIILLVATLAIRIAPLHHAHAEADDVSHHDLMPHFHTHSHDHGHGHSHEMEIGHGCEELIHEETLSGEKPHDQDAVYLESTIAASGSHRGEAELSNFLASLSLPGAQVHASELPPPSGVAERPPDPLVFGPTLYLRNLSLRI